MCGIVSIFNIQEQTPALRQKALRMSGKLRHRGPDWSGIYCGGTAILAHERLAIVDPESGRQPLFSPDRKQVLAVNGEIYNHREIRSRYAGKYQFQTGSDCEVILALYREQGERFLDGLDGIFAFALYDIERDDYLIARDPIGVIPLYYGRDKEGRLYVASELKALEGQCDKYAPFPPGHVLTGRDVMPRRYYDRDWFSYDNVKDNPASVDELRDGLEAAVRRQMMSDVPYGVLLSGGLDSSIISAVAQKYAKRRIETGGEEAAWWPRLHSFAVGLRGAPDLEKARLVAEHIGTVHHEINYTIQEGLDALSDVVYYTETYDVTVRKLMKLHLYDCLRANKSLAAWGVEGRVPFLDTEFLDIAMRLNPEAKMCPGAVVEKKILREAFAPMLPQEVAWRQKEQFSDGVGYSWIDTLKRITADSVSDYEMEHAAQRFPVNPPRCKEEYFYRSLFAAHFPSDDAARSVPSVPSVACSTAEALAWDASFKDKNDPSGRAVSGVHEQAY